LFVVLSFQEKEKKRDDKRQKEKRNADELFEARINLIMRFDSITDMRNACASAFTNIDQIRTTKIGKNLLLKLFYRQAYRVFSSLLTIGLYEKKKKKSFFK